MSMDDPMSRELMTHEPKPPARTVTHQGVIPSTIAEAGEGAAHRFFEFFTANIRNPNTRRAYHRAAMAFFGWLLGERVAARC